MQWLSIVNILGLLLLRMSACRRTCCTAGTTRTQIASQRTCSAPDVRGSGGARLSMVPHFVCVYLHLSLSLSLPPLPHSHSRLSLPVPLFPLFLSLPPLERERKETERRKVMCVHSTFLLPLYHWHHALLGRRLRLPEILKSQWPNTFDSYLAL